ncbi:hypothetical protein YPPY48_0206, partial [Yersinia pestis PY-48]
MQGHTDDPLWLFV